MNENDRSPTTSARLSPKRSAAEGSTSASDPSMSPFLSDSDPAALGRGSYPRARNARVGTRPTRLRRRRRLAARHRATAHDAGRPPQRAYGASIALGLRAACPCLSCSPSTTIGTLSTRRDAACPAVRPRLPDRIPRRSGRGAADAARARGLGRGRGARARLVVALLGIGASPARTRAPAAPARRARAARPGRTSGWISRRPTPFATRWRWDASTTTCLGRPGRSTRSSTRRSPASCSSGREIGSVVPQTVHVVGETWSGRAYELREALGQCAAPHVFCLAESE